MLRKNNLNCSERFLAVLSVAEIIELLKLQLYNAALLGLESQERNLEICDPKVENCQRFKLI